MLMTTARGLYLIFFPLQGSSRLRWCSSNGRTVLRCFRRSAGICVAFSCNDHHPCGYGQVNLSDQNLVQLAHLLRGLLHIIFSSPWTSVRS